MYSAHRLLQRFFEWYSHYLYHFWPVFVIVPILVTGGLSYGFRYLEESTVREIEYVFVPTNGQSHYELACLQEHWPYSATNFIPGKHFGFKYWIEMIMAVKNDTGNILTKKCLSEAKNLTEFIVKNITVPLDPSIPVNGGNRNVTYDEICLSYNGHCFTNHLVNFLQQEKSLRGYFDLTYPISNRDLSPTYVANIIGGVELRDQAGHMSHAKALRTLYFLQQEPDFVSQLSERWSYAMQDYIVNYTSTCFDSTVFHTNTLKDGLDANMTRIRPKFALTMVIISLFSTICTLVPMKVKIRDKSKRKWAKNVWAIDWIRSKPGMAMFGILTAGFGVSSGMGFLLLTGIVPFHPMTGIMPFLVFSIGIDDMFIMLAAWRRSDHTRSIKERLIWTMSDSAVSITITSVTDALSFFIGCATTIPAVKIFCMYTGVAIVFAYIYQITFFAGLLVVCGILEEYDAHGLLPMYTDLNWFQIFFWSGTTLKDMGRLEYRTKSTTKIKTISGPKTAIDHAATNGHLHVKRNGRAVHSASSHAPCKTDTSIVTRAFTTLGNLITSAYGTVVVFAMLGVYLVIGIWGCLGLKEGLEPKHLLLETHYAVKWYEYAALYIWPEGPKLQLIINNPPPDFSNRTDRDDLMRALGHFEDTHHIMRKNATLFWLMDYYDYLQGIGFNLSSPEETDTKRVWTQRLKYWNQRGNGKTAFKNDIIWGDTKQGQDPLRIYATRATMGLRNFVTPHDHKISAVQSRKFAAMIPRFNITTYHQYWPFADQYIIILPNTLQNIGIGLGTMICISLILIPNLVCAILIALSIISIDIGVIGYMTWWGVNLDTISMITVIMSIGFSVDLAAHISYAFSVAEGTGRERVVTALTTLGIPVIQGACSTLLGVIALTTVQAYMIVTFFKTVFLVILFGLLHGLVFLPAWLRVASDITTRLSNRNSIQSVITSKPNHPISKPTAATSYTNGGIHAVSVIQVANLPQSVLKTQKGQRRQQIPDSDEAPIQPPPVGARCSLEVTSSVPPFEIELAQYGLTGVSLRNGGSTNNWSSLRRKVHSEDVRNLSGFGRIEIPNGRHQSMYETQLHSS